MNTEPFGGMLQVLRAQHAKILNDLVEHTDIQARAITVSKSGYAYRVPRFDPPTDEEMAAWRAKHEQEEKLRLAAVADLTAALERHADPAAQAVMGIHHPTGDEQDECAGCSTSDYYNDAWPCETITAIADAYGVAVPEGLK